mgnify:CR=1 FL=1
MVFLELFWKYTFTVAFGMWKTVFQKQSQKQGIQTHPMKGKWFSWKITSMENIFPTKKKYFTSKENILFPTKRTLIENCFLLVPIPFLDLSREDSSKLPNVLGLTSDALNCKLTGQAFWPSPKPWKRGCGGSR